MTLGDWRDVSLILLSLEGMAIALIWGIIFYYLWKGFRVAYRWLQWTGLPQGRRYTSLMKTYSQYYSYKIARPIVKTDEVMTQATGIIRALGTPSRSRSRR